MSLPAQAVTIINTDRVETVLARDFIQDCEWYDLIETRTTVTYEDLVPREHVYANTYAYSEPPPYELVVLNEVRLNTCYPLDSPDRPAFCDATFFIGPIVTQIADMGMWLKQWQEIFVTTRRVYVNRCVGDCEHVLTPEPSTLFLIGVGLIYGGKQWRKKRAMVEYPHSDERRHHRTARTRNGADRMGVVSREVRSHLESF